MFYPLMEDEDQNKYIVIETEQGSSGRSTEQQALEFVIELATITGTLPIYFSSEIIEIKKNDDRQVIVDRVIEPSTNKIIVVGLIDGPLFKERTTKKEPINFMTGGNNEVGLYVAMNPDDFTPYVVLVVRGNNTNIIKEETGQNKMEIILSPAEARALALELYSSGAASEMDCFFRVALEESTSEMDETDRELFTENLRKARQLYIESLEKREPSEQAVPVLSEEVENPVEEGKSNEKDNT